MKLFSQKLVLILVSTLSFFSYSQEDISNGDESEIQLKLTSTKILQDTLYLDVPYGTNVKQTYDIYLPKGRSSLKTKVIILIHGGSWTYGDKSRMKHYVTAIQRSNPNHAIVNMNYALAQSGVRHAFPNQFLNIQTLIDALKYHQLHYNIALEFGLVGGSAGGQLALMFDSVYDKLDEVKFVCSITGPTKFNDPVYTERPDFNLLLDLLVDPVVYPDIENNLQILSPAFRVTRSTSPTFLFYGNKDPRVPLSTAIFLNSQLELHEVDHELIVLNGGHGDWGEIGNKQIYDGLERIINKYLSM